MPKPPLGRSNNDDRRQWRKQGVAVGAAASKTQAQVKRMLGAATRHGREAPERARMLKVKHLHSDNFTLTKKSAYRCV